MNVMEAIRARRSYRGKYEATPVPREDLARIMQAGLDAPSGCNKQTTSLIAVDDPEVLARLHSVIDPPVGATAPAAICVLTRRINAYRDRCFAVQDYSAAIENMLLAVVELGYQSCWFEGHITDDDRICEKMAQILNVPEEYELVCFLPIGKAEGKPADPVKKAFGERAWFNAFPSGADRPGQQEENPPAGKDIRIRRFEAEDAKAVSELIIRTVRISNTRDYSAEMMEELVKTETPEHVLQRASWTHFYVAEDGEKLIGCGAIGPYWGKEDESSLFTIFVLPEHQGKGVGRRIVETLEKDEYFLRARRIEIPASITGLPFYRKLGYDFKDGNRELDSEQLYRLEKFRDPAGEG